MQLIKKQILITIIQKQIKKKINYNLDNFKEDCNISNNLKKLTISSISHQEH